MLDQNEIVAVSFAAALCVPLVPASASDAGRLSDFNGQWVRAAEHAQWDPTKPRGLAQGAPLTPEYEAIFKANLKALHEGNLGADPQVYCLPTGMPRVMIAYEPMEVIVTGDTTYIRVDHLADFRRIYTDGRAWPEAITPTFDGYSVGKWVADPDGRRVLEAETRGLKGPRTLDADGLPLHRDNRTIVKERFFLDARNRDVLHDEITTIDHAFTRPWTVTRDYNREPHPLWPEFLCTEANNHIPIGAQFYFRSGDGYLMPAYKDQPPPDLRNFAPQR